MGSMLQLTSFPEASKKPNVCSPCICTEQEVTEEPKNIPSLRIPSLRIPSLHTQSLRTSQVFTFETVRKITPNPIHEGDESTDTYKIPPNSPRN